MTGHVRERRPGRWELRVFTGRDPLTGRKKYATKTIDATGIRQAERALAAYVTELARTDTAGTGTFGDLLDRWYAQGEPDWSPNTCQLHRWVIDHRLDGLKPLDVRQIGTADLDRYYRALRTRGSADGGPVAASTVVRIHNIVRSALKQAVAWGWIDSNPAERARPGRIETAEITPPTTDAVRHLVELARAEDPDLLVFLALSAETGARRGELAALRWSDLDATSVTIGRTLVIGPDTEDQRRRHAGHIWPAGWHRGQPTALIEKPTPKNRNSRRTIRLSTATVDLLAGFRLRSAERAMACGVQLPASGFLFPAEPDATRPLRPLTWSRRFSKLRDKAGLDGVRLHDLRHYVATTLLAAGVDLATVAGRLGHGGGGKTTLAIYGHFLAGGEPDRAAAELLAALTATPPDAGTAEVIRLRKA